MKTSIKQQERFEARLPKEQKKFFEEGKETIRKKEQIIASERDSQIFFDAVTIPAKPSETLKKALDDYNAFNSLLQSEL
jgi:uncharacterized protein (DUF1778 family)